MLSPAYFEVRQLSIIRQSHVCIMYFIIYVGLFRLAIHINPRPLDIFINVHLIISLHVYG